MDSEINGFEWRQATTQETLEHLDSRSESMIEIQEESEDRFANQLEGYYEGFGDNVDLICEDFQSPENLAPSVHLFDQHLKVSLKIDKFRMELSRSELDQMSSQFRKLDD